MSKREPRQASNDRQSEQEEQYEEITIERSARSRKSTKQVKLFIARLKGSTPQLVPLAAECAAYCLQIERVRVWWPPTKDKNRTGFSGAYW
jgi:hypothetical protein